MSSEERAILEAGYSRVFRPKPCQNFGRKVLLQSTTCRVAASVGRSAAHTRMMQSAMLIAAVTRKAKQGMQNSGSQPVMVTAARSAQSL